MKKNLIYFPLGITTLILIFLVSTGYGLSDVNLLKVNEKETNVTGVVLDNANMPLIGVNVFIKNSTLGTITDLDGKFQIIVPSKYDALSISYTGYTTQEVKVDHASSDCALKIILKAAQSLDEIIVSSAPVEKNEVRMNSKMEHNVHSKLAKRQINIYGKNENVEKEDFRGNVIGDRNCRNTDMYNSEEYGKFIENQFIDPLDEALSTFSVDVDRAGYSNVRRFIDHGQLPPTDAVRVEEMINYFAYDYPQPDGDDPIALQSTLTSCPWNKEHQLMHVGLQGKSIGLDKLPPSNIVFLIDVSGSMNNTNKLPLLKSSFKMLLNNLREKDRVAIVTYAGRAGVALESTSASEKNKIQAVMDGLGAGGSTAGAQGILTAYKIAKENFIKDGNNRIILATDGDFNVGVSSNDELEKLIEKERKSGVFLSVLGFGMGNYKDEKMQTLADKGNGNHSYIDNIQEARKVLVTEFGGTLFTIAKDVKLQIEFNPAHVLSYRLIGYENRLLAKEDFNDDTKDAGEMGAGHVVTAIYEIVPVGSNSSFVGSVDSLKYQQVKKRPKAKNTDELATIKFRYKQPQGSKSKKIVEVILPKSTKLTSCNDDVKFSIAVAEFGMILRESQFINNGNLKDVISLANKSRGKDKEGYRAEFVRLVKSVNDMEGSLAEKE